jgi:uncharacterized membrane protein HdeD (DUF308 family)
MYKLNLPTSIITVVMGSLILIHGVFYLIKYLYDGLGKRFFAHSVIIAVIAIVLGVFTIFNPFKTITALGVMYGIYLLSVALDNGLYAYKMFKSGEEIYPLVTIITIFDIVMAVLVMINPFDSFMLISRLIGLFAICSGLFNGLIAMLFKKRAKYILDLYK